MNRMKHGVLTPALKTRHAPSRAMNARSRRKDKTTSKLRLDKLLRAAKPKICINRRLGGIGDVLMTTPITKAIKLLIPRCHLVYATDLQYSQGALAEIIEHNPYVDELIASPTINQGEYDYIVDVTTTGLDKEKSGAIPPNRIDMFADAVGIDVSADPVPIYMVRPEEDAWAQSELKTIFPKMTKESKIIALQARSNDARRTWPLEYVEELAQMLAKTPDYHVLLFDWGNTVDRWPRDIKDLYCITDLKYSESAALINLCDVIVCPDSSMLHTAGALGKKIVTVFGPIPPESRINYYSNATAVTKNLPCHPCWYSPRCSQSEGHKLDCLSTLKASEVYSAVIAKVSEEYKVATHAIYGANLTNKNQDNVIMVRRSTDGLGDILMATPAIEALALKYPKMKIEVACQERLFPALENNPNISRLISIDKPYNARRYYMVVDISSPCAHYEAARITMNKPVQKSRVEVFAEACGVRELLPTLKPIYKVKEEERQWAQDFIKKVVPTEDKKKPIIGFGLRSAEMYRDWPKEYQEELFSILKDNFNLMLIDHSRDNAYPDVIDACGFSLRKAVALLEQCDGMVTVDTGLLHFATALDIPTIALFGPIDYKARCKGYDNVSIIKSDMQCTPCWRNGEMPCGSTGLIRGYSKCMQSIPAKTVAKIINNKFSGGNE